MDDENDLAASDAAYSEIYADTPSQSGEELSEEPESSAPPLKRGRSHESLETGAKKSLKLQDIGVQPIRSRVWQHVFSFLAPQDLGRLLRVSPRFCALLTSTDAVSSEMYLDDAESRCLVFRDPESIWAESRVTHFPDLPVPLSGLSELEIWRLILGTRCQYCGRADSNPGDIDSRSRVIWPFAARLCDICLEDQTQDESTLLLSGASVSRKLLPFAFLSNERSVVHLSKLQSNPHNFEVQDLRKVFYLPQITECQDALDDPRYGHPLEKQNLLQDLNFRKDSRMADSQRWEIWEDNGGFDGILNQTTNLAQYNQHNARSLPEDYVFLTPASRPSREMAPLMHPMPGTWRSSRPSSVASSVTVTLPPSLTTSPMPRSVHEANEGKSARRAEIERRCQQLDPPIRPEILIHMDSFNSAIQISAPFTEQAWDVLKPRLLEQRGEAESRWREVQELAVHISSPDVNVSAQAWDEQQAPLRNRLSKYADHVISNEWRSGHDVTKHNASEFAVQVLRYTRKQFEYDTSYNSSDYRQNNSTKALASGLVLDTMKWVYVEKIKRIAERFERNLFGCRELDCNSASKFTFEGVIQHYSELHPTELSDEGGKLAWRKIPWTSDPPFLTEPSDRHLPTRSKTNYKDNRFRRPDSRKGQKHSNNPSMVYVQGQDSRAIPSQVVYVAQAFPNPSHYHLPAQYPISAHGSPPPQSPFGGVTMYPPPPPPPSSLSGSVVQASWTSPHQHHAPQLSPPPFYPTYNTPRGTSVPDPYSVAGRFQAPATNSSFHSSFSNPTSSFYSSQQDNLARIADNIYTSISSVQGLAKSLIVYVVIRQSVSQFRSLFANEPQLQLFFDCVFSHPLMTSLKMTPQLGCKACATGIDAVPGEHGSLQPAAVKRMYHFHSLLLHFKHDHIERQLPAQGSSLGGAFRPNLDWKEDMIELPKDDYISSCVNRHGLRGPTREIFLASFPHLFSPERPIYLPPNVDGVKADEYDPQHPELLAPEPYSQYHAGTYQNSSRKRRSDDYDESSRGQPYRMQSSDGQEYELHRINRTLLPDSNINMEHDRYREPRSRDDKGYDRQNFGRKGFTEGRDMGKRIKQEPQSDEDDQHILGAGRRP